MSLSCRHCTLDACSDCVVQYADITFALHLAITNERRWLAHYGPHPECAHLEGHPIHDMRHAFYHTKEYQDSLIKRIQYLDSETLPSVSQEHTQLETDTMTRLFSKLFKLEMSINIDEQELNIAPSKDRQRIEQRILLNRERLRQTRAMAYTAFHLQSPIIVREVDWIEYAFVQTCYNRLNRAQAQAELNAHNCIMRRMGKRLSFQEE